MGRNDGSKANNQANQQMTQIQLDQVARANRATDAYNSKLGTLEKGGNIAANPYTNPDYLRNENLMTAGASSAANAGAKDAIQQQALRTGSNTAANKMTFMKLARQKAQQQTDATAGRYAQDYDKNLDWQKMILGATLAPAGVDTSMFSTATSGRNEALGNLTSIQNQGNQMWSNIIGSALQGGALVGSKAIG